MAQRSRTAPQTRSSIHVVIPDSSALFCDDKSTAVNPSIDQMWEDYRGSFRLELVVPSTVRGEIIHQHARTSSKLLKKATDALSQLEMNIGKRYAIRTDRAAIEQVCEKKFDKWIESKGGSVELTPYAAIDWAAVEHCSINRLPPFTPEGPDRRAEKGFRDALILETICCYCHNESRNVRIMFVCSDSLLRDTVIDRLQHDDRVACFESVDDMRSYFELVKRESSASIALAIGDKASSRFFEPKKEETLYYRAGVRKRVLDRYGDLLRTPSNWDELPDSVVPAERGTLVPLEAGTNFIGVAQFQRVDGDGWYQWKTPYEFVRGYARSSSQIVDRPEGIPFLHIVFFSLYWRSRIASNGNFLGVEFLDVEVHSSVVRAPTEDDVLVYRLDERP